MILGDRGFVAAEGILMGGGSSFSGSISFLFGILSKSSLSLVEVPSILNMCLGYDNHGNGKRERSSFGNRGKADGTFSLF